MDSFDFTDETSGGRNVTDLVWNILTVVVLVSILCVAGYTVSIIANPSTVIRPFPDLFATPAPVYTPTPSPISILPATWTPGPTNTSVPTFTPLPTQSPFPTSTPGPLPPGDLSYKVKGDAQLIEDFSHEKCEWMGVAGSVSDLRDSPVAGLFVQIGGILDGKIFDTQTTMTGIAGQYGGGGYEFTIANKPIKSEKTLWIQLIDQAGLPLSDKVFFDTSDDCSKNLVFISFEQVK